MNNDRAPVWSWRDAIRQTDVPPGTKLLCLTLSLYMSSAGRGAWPSMAQLAADTGLTRQALSVHVGRAVQAGLLHATRRRHDDGTLSHYVYHPRFPAAVRLAREPADCGLVDAPTKPGKETGHGASHVKKPDRKRTTQEDSTREVDSTSQLKGLRRQ